jgi:hypothetical protein
MLVNDKNMTDTDNTLNIVISQFHSGPKKMSIMICAPRTKHTDNIAANQLISDTDFTNELLIFDLSSLNEDNIGKSTTS